MNKKQDENVHVYDYKNIIELYEKEKDIFEKDIDRINK
jgi:hypothetical protein